MLQLGLCRVTDVGICLPRDVMNQQNQHSTINTENWLITELFQPADYIFSSTSDCVTSVTLKILINKCMNNTFINIHIIYVYTSNTYRAYLQIFIINVTEYRLQFLNLLLIFGKIKQFQ